MVTQGKVENLIQKLASLFNEEASKTDITVDETLDVLQRLVAQVCAHITQSTSSPEQLDSFERKVHAKMNGAIHPFFDERRKELIEYGVYRFAPYSKIELFDRIIAILAENNVNIEDGLYFVKRLLETVLTFHTQHVNDAVTLEAIEKKILKDFNEKIAQTVRTICVRRSLLS